MDTEEDNNNNQSPHSPFQVITVQGSFNNLSALRNFNVSEFFKHTGKIQGSFNSVASKEHPLQLLNFPAVRRVDTCFNDLHVETLSLPNLSVVYNCSFTNGTRLECLELMAEVVSVHSEVDYLDHMLGEVETFTVKKFRQDPNPTVKKPLDVFKKGTAPVDRSYSSFMPTCPNLALVAPRATPFLAKPRPPFSERINEVFEDVPASRGGWTIEAAEEFASDLAQQFLANIGRASMEPASRQNAGPQTQVNQVNQVNTVAVDSANKENSNDNNNKPNQDEADTGSTTPANTAATTTHDSTKKYDGEAAQEALTDMNLTGDKNFSQNTSDAPPNTDATAPSKFDSDERRKLLRELEPARVAAVQRALKNRRGIRRKRE